MELNPNFLNQTEGQKSLLAESPMDRYECCTHCRGVRCPRHDGHLDPCKQLGCIKGVERLGESSSGGRMD